MSHSTGMGPKRRLRKIVKRVFASAGDFGEAVEKQFLRKMSKFGKNRRFIIGWLLLFVLIGGLMLAQIQSLGNYYQTRRPVAGGIYTEGIIGTFTNANPIYATNDVDTAVSKLLFSGLFTYDDDNKLVGDLAKSWTVDATGRVYTVILKDDLKWHDGSALNADDVVFTYEVIQNPDAESPLRASWSGIKVAKVNNRTVSFTLPAQLTSFIHTATNGILPKHILKDVSMAGMRSVSFNSTSPVGSGPFMWQSSQSSGTGITDSESIIGLSPNPTYHRGKPKLRSFVVHSYMNRDKLLQAFQKGELSAVAGLEALPRDVMTDSQEYNMPLTAAKMVFFRTTTGVFTDQAVRRALVAAAYPDKIIDALPYQARPVKEPLLMGQLGYNEKFAQQTNNLTAAEALLDQAGWVKAEDGVRSKNNQRLAFSLTAVDTSENRLITSKLKSDWKKLGVDLSLDIQDELTFRSTVGTHAYESLLYTISIGTDSDVFVYWHSSQADVRSASRLNLSEYNSKIVDEAVGGGRSRSDTALRNVKYQALLQQWQQDAPALGLYQPRFHYVTSSVVHNLEEHVINTPTDRFNSVHNWMIRTARVTNERQ